MASFIGNLIGFVYDYCSVLIVRMELMCELFSVYFSQRMNI